MFNNNLKNTFPFENSTFVSHSGTKLLKFVIKRAEHQNQTQKVKTFQRYHFRAKNNKFNTHGISISNLDCIASIESLIAEDACDGRHASDIDNDRTPIRPIRITDTIDTKTNRNNTRYTRLDSIKHASPLPPN